MGAIGWIVGIAMGAVIVVFIVPWLLFPLIPFWIAGAWRQVIELIIGTIIMFIAWRIGSMLI